MERVLQRRTAAWNLITSGQIREKCGGSVCFYWNRISNLKDYSSERWQWSNRSLAKAQCGPVSCAGFMLMGVVQCGLSEMQSLDSCWKDKLQTSKSVAFETAISSWFLVTLKAKDLNIDFLKINTTPDLKKKNSTKLWNSDQTWIKYTWNDIDNYYVYHCKFNSVSSTLLIQELVE